MAIIEAVPARASSQLQEAVSQHRRLAWPESLRALAACYVVACHAPMIVGGILKTTPLIIQRLNYYVFSWGHFAVDLFIVLSGFVLMLPVVVRQSAGQTSDYTLRGGNTLAGALAFYKARAWRILPPYYLAMAISLAVIAAGIGAAHPSSLWGFARHVTPHGILTHILMVQDFFIDDSPQINSVFWSISVEARIYILFPFFMWLCQRFGSVAAAGIAFVVGYLAAGLALMNKGIDQACCPHYLALFAGGALCCDLLYGPLSRKIKWANLNHSGKRVFLIFTILFSLVAAMLLVRARMPYPVLDFFTGLSAILLLFLIGSNVKNGARSRLEWPPLVRIGGFSYSIYLIHFPFLAVMWYLFVSPLGLNGTASVLIMWLVVCPLAVVVAYLFFLPGERPFHTLAKRVRPMAFDAASVSAQY